MTRPVNVYIDLTKKYGGTHAEYSSQYIAFLKNRSIQVTEKSRLKIVGALFSRLDGMMFIMSSNVIDLVPPSYCEGTKASCITCCFI